MTVAYFDCFAGAAGDMIVASLLGAGANLSQLRADLARLGVGGYALRAETVQRGGLAGVQFCVDLEPHTHQHGHPHEHEHGHEHQHGHAHEHEHDQGDAPSHHHPRHRGLGDVLALIEAAELAPRARERAMRIFRRLAEAEAKVHGCTVNDVHFHEVGAVDSIVDIVGACLALEQLDVDRVLCSRIPLGSGTVECAHGVLPVPAPATAELVRGADVEAGGIAGEATTPTGASILLTLAEAQGPLPAMRVTAIGQGAGTRNDGERANVLRVFVGEEATDDDTADTLVELSANVDDCSGEWLARAIEQLLAAGCVDAWAAPVVMKKSRPAWQVSALCDERDVAEAERILFAETTTFGVRRRPCRRRKLARRHVTVETPYGPVRVKEGRSDGRLVSASPEWADCAAAADSHHVAAKEVYAAAQAAWREVAGEEKGG